MLYALGEFGYLTYRVWGCLRYIVRDYYRILTQIERIGIDAIPIVLMVGVFAGTTIAWQAAYQFRGVAPFSLLGGEVAKTIIMEMAPVLTGLVMSGRVGASMTAEIGAMKASEQIDALKTMSIDPVRYIVMPRFVAMVSMMPILALFAMVVAVLGALAVSTYFLSVSYQVFMDSIRSMFEFKDLIGGLVKATCFGIEISLIGCYKGFSAQGGTQGLGDATISSFVVAAISVLVSDFMLWVILF